MNSYTTKTLLENTIFDYTTIRSLNRKNFFDDIILKDKKYYYSQNDLNKLISLSKFCENSYKTEEVGELFNYKKPSPMLIIKKYNLKNTIDYIKVNSRYFFKKAVINNLVKKINTTIDSTYISISECNKAISKQTYIYDGIRQGYFKKYIFNDQIFITKNDFNIILNEISIIEHSYTSTDISKYLGVPYQDISQDLTKKLSPIKIRKRLYFDKNKFDEFLKKSKFSTTAYQKPFKKNSKLENIAVTDSLNVPENYLTISMMCKKFNISKDIIYVCINKGQFKNTIRRYNQYYIDPNEYILLKDEMNQSISSNEFQKKVLSETGIKLPLENYGPLKKMFPTAFKWDKLGQSHYRIPLHATDYFMKNEFKAFSIKYLTEREKNAHKVFDLLVSNLEIGSLQYTINEFIIFATAVLNNSHAAKKKLLAYDLFATLNELTNRLSTDFYYLSDKDIQKLILSLPKRCKLHFSSFLNKYKKNNPSKCNYSGNYNNYTTVKPKATTKNAYYTEEEWFKYLNYLCDIDTHIEEAFRRQSYARRWLYHILHFCTTLRKSTYFNLPNILNINIDHYTLDWFKENEFTLYDAQYIVNNAKLYFDNTIANKNGLANKFIIFPSMLIPVAIALIIAEKHSRLNNSKLLIDKITSNQQELKKYFGNNLDGFQSLKCNRTLLTYTYAIASSTEGYTGIAYSLASTQRSHTVNQMGVAPVTHQYIYSTNKDGDASKIAYELQKRGIFGWLYKSILELIYPKENLSIPDTTTKIQSLQSIFTVKNIESLSQILEDQSFSYEKVTKELASLEKFELEKLVRQLKNFELPSKIDYTQCIKAGNCPYSTNTMCYMCAYSIPTNYTLFTLNSNLMDIFHKLDKTPMDAVRERERYSHMIKKILSIITEARVDFENYNSNNSVYINAFIDFSTLAKKFTNALNTKFI